MQAAKSSDKSYINKSLQEQLCRLSFVLKRTGGHFKHLFQFTNFYTSIQEHMNAIKTTWITAINVFLILNQCLNDLKLQLMRMMTFQAALKNYKTNNRLLVINSLNIKRVVQVLFVQKALTLVFWKHGIH